MGPLAALMGYRIDVSGDWDYIGGGKCRLNVALSMPVVRIETCGAINTSNELDSPQAVVRYVQVFIEQIVVGGQNYIDSANLAGLELPHAGRRFPRRTSPRPTNPTGNVVRIYGAGTCPNGNSTCIKTTPTASTSPRRPSGRLSYGQPIINVAQ
jgi:hypothetical protein